MYRYLHSTDNEGDSVPLYMYLHSIDSEGDSVQVLTQYRQ